MKLLQRGISMDEELLDEIFADLAADLVDLSDDEIKDRILKYGLNPADMQDVYNTVKAVQEAEALGDENSDPLSLENVDAILDANTKEAKRMANEDKTKVKVTEEDKDSDGDTDKTTIEKENPEDDKKLIDNTIKEGDNSSETEDKPHEEPKLKNKTNQFARFLGENRLGGM